MREGWDLDAFENDSAGAVVATKGYAVVVKRSITKSCNCQSYGISKDTWGHSL